MESQQSLPVLDIVIVVVYLLGSVAYGAWFFKKTKSADSFLVGGRGMPGWALGISIIGAYFSSISFVALPGKAYRQNWSAFVFSLTIPIVCLAAHYYFIPLYRKKLQTSAYEHLEHRFGYWARAFSAACLIILQIVRTGVVIYLLALVTRLLAGWDIQMVIIILGVLTLFYTVLGGMEGVIWADVIQTIVFVSGAIACCIAVVVMTPGGFGHIVETGWEQGKFGFGGWNLDLVKETFWVILLFGILENVKNFGIDQNYVQRFIAAKNDREARKSLWLGGLAYVPVSAMFIFMGTALFVYYQTIPNPPAGLPPIERGDNVFPFFIVNALPPGVVGLVIAALLATGMDTMAINVHTSGTVFIADFYCRLIRPNSTDTQQLRMARWASFIIGGLGTLVGLSLVWGNIAEKAIQDVWWQLSSIFGGGMIGLFLLGILVPRATKRSALLGVGAGMLAIAWGTFSVFFEGDLARFKFPLHRNLIGVMGMIVVLTIGWIDSLIGTPSAVPTDAAIQESKG